MNTLAEHEIEFTKGLISEGGFRALGDAEVYGNVSSIGAMESSLRILFKALVRNGVIEVDHPLHGKSYIKSRSEFEQWCKEILPSTKWENVQSL